MRIGTLFLSIFSMLNTKDPVLVWTAIVLAIGVVFPIMYAPQAQLLRVNFLLKFVIAVFRFRYSWQVFWVVV